MQHKACKGHWEFRFIFRSFWQPAQIHIHVQMRLAGTSCASVAGCQTKFHDETCLIDQIEFENMIKEIKQEYGSGFSKNYREMPEGEFVKSVLDEMELWMFIRKEELAHQIKICPLTGKIQGSYPEDYMGGRNDE